MSRDRIYYSQNTQKPTTPQNGQLDKMAIAARLPYQKQQLAYLQGKLSELRSSNEKSNSENNGQSNYFYEAQQMRESGYISQISNLQSQIGGGTSTLGNFNPFSNQNSNSPFIPTQGGQLSNSGYTPSSSGGGGGAAASTAEEPKSFLGQIGDAVSGGLQKIGKAISDGADWFVSQLKGNSNTNEDTPDAQNSNCGPTSLLMVGRMLGAMGGGSADADNQIEQVRGMMGADSDETKWTDTNQLVQGAQAMGLHASASSGKNSEDVVKALQGGGKVIVNVNPSGYGGPDTGHFAVVTAINGDQVTLYDPAKQAPITISRSQLDAAMSSKGGHMVSVSK